MIFVWLVLNLTVIIVDGAIQDHSKTDVNAERANAVVGMYRQIMYIKKQASFIYPNLAISDSFFLGINIDLLSLEYV